MSLGILDKDYMRGILTNMWKVKLNTNEDPAGKNGKWIENDPHYEKGERPSPIGLLGGLSDSTATELLFDESKAVYMPEDVYSSPITQNNLNGLNPKGETDLSLTYINSTTTTHTTTNAIKIGVQAEWTILKDILTLKFSFEYNHSWSDATATTKSETMTQSAKMFFDVPKGKIYLGVLTAKKHKLIIPYRALIYVDGITETYFASKINGLYYYSMSIGEAFDNISEWGIAGEESQYFSKNPENPSGGIITQYGELTANKTADFESVKYDITDGFKDGKIPSPESPDMAEFLASDQAPVFGKIIEKIKL